MEAEYKEKQKMKLEDLQKCSSMTQVIFEEAADRFVLYKSANNV
jgi:hypothetical protein